MRAAVHLASTIRACSQRPGRRRRTRLVRIDSPAGLLAFEIVLEQLLDLGDPGAAADEHDPSAACPPWCLLEQVAVELLEARPGELLRDVDAVEERLDLHAHLVQVAERALDALALCALVLDELP